MTESIFELSESEFPEGPPSELWLGGRWQWKREVEGITYSDYTLDYRITPFGGGSVILQSALVRDSRFVVIVEGVTFGWPSNSYARWTEILSKVGELGGQVLNQGVFYVHESPVIDTSDPRSDARKILDAIDDLLLGRFNKDVQSITIRGRSLVKMTLEELQQARVYYERRVAQDEGTAKSSVILTSFG
jgi:hypothetical protein